jgi:DNA-binding MarR family transcriptional regulator
MAREADTVVLESTVGYVIDVLNTARCLERDVNSALVEDGLRVELWRILYTLSQSPGALMGELSTTLAIPAASLTRLIDELSDSGLVFRRPAPDDKRKAGVYLSRMGSERLLRSSAIVASRVPRNSGANGLSNVRAASST